MLICPFNASCSLEYCITPLALIRLLMLAALVMSSGCARTTSGFASVGVATFEFASVSGAASSGVYYHNEHPHMQRIIADETGTITIRDKNGRIYSQEQIRNGKRHGVSVYWFANGDRDEKHYENGVLHGPCLGWYSDGSKRKAGLYQLGVPYGLWTEWHPDGSKQKAGLYQMGVPDGLWTEWYPDGMVRVIREYGEGQLISEVWGDSRMTSSSNAIMLTWANRARPESDLYTFERALHFVKPGMTEESVHELLGQPDLTRDNTIIYGMGLGIHAIIRTHEDGTVMNIRVEHYYYYP